MVASYSDCVGGYSLYLAFIKGAFFVGIFRWFWEFREILGVPRFFIGADSSFWGCVVEYL